MEKKAAGYLFGNDIATPSQRFVDEFLKLTGIYLMHSNAKFYEHLLSIVTNCFIVNLPAIDDYFGVLDPDYKPDACTYMGEKCSMKGYVGKKFGNMGLAMFEYLMKSDFTEEFDFDNFKNHDND